MCPRDYTPALLRWVDKENLPTFLGGTSNATLLDDAGPWNNRDIIAEVEEEHRRAAQLVSDDDLSTTSDVDERRISQRRIASDGMCWLLVGCWVLKCFAPSLRRLVENIINTMTLDAVRCQHPPVCDSHPAGGPSDGDEATGGALPAIRTVARTASSTADDADDFHSPRSAMSQASFLSAAPTFGESTGKV